MENILKKDVKKIYVFGNEYLEFDSFAGKVAEKLKNDFNIVHCRSPDDLIDVNDVVCHSGAGKQCCGKGIGAAGGENSEKETEMIILDVVKDIKEPIIITDPKQLKTRNILSLHDFDLAFFLNLIRELGEGKKIKIIGVPQKGDVEEIVKKVREYV